MSKTTYLLVAGLALLVVLVTGCGATDDRRGSGSPPSFAPSSAPSSTTATLADSDTCLGRTDARYETVPAGLALPIAVLGDSSRAVVLADQSDRNACAWLPFARELVSAGFEVALFDYEVDPVADSRAVVRYLHAHGARSVGLVGASEGAKVAIIVGAMGRPAPAAVVSLSPETGLGNRLVATYARRLDAPTLLVTAERDPFGTADSTAKFLSLVPAASKQRVVIPGRRHGIDLLDDGGVDARVLSFLRAHV